ncbi:Lrp/AsnC family transcriptional regulator, partial [Candidatus Woesearchaeota archaeon]
VIPLDYMLKLDKLDRAILCALDCNSRQSLSSIGKNVRLKKESVHYRIQRLEARKITNGYPTIISLAKMGKIHAEMFLRFHNVTVGLKNEMISFFTSQKEIVYVASCKGGWDLLLGIIVNEVAELSAVKNRICDKYSMYFAASSISLTIETYFFGRKYLMGKDIHITQHIDKPGSTKTDAVDNVILSCISKNARTSLLDIAKKAGISAKSAGYRIKKLQKSRIIQKYTLSLNMNSLGMSSYKMLIRLKSSQHKKRLLEYFHRQPNTTTVREVLSDWNLEPTFEVESSEQFYRIVEELEDMFGESIMSHSSFMTDNEYKSKYYL